MTDKTIILPNDVFDRFVDELNEPPKGPNKAMREVFKRTRKLRLELAEQRKKHETQSN